MMIAYPKSCFCQQAWAGGLEHYLSTDPPPALVADVADTLSQSMSGAVVVQALNGTNPINHGPGLEFYPTVINLSPGKENATFNYLCAAHNFPFLVLVHIKLGPVPPNPHPVCTRTCTASNATLVDSSPGKENATFVRVALRPEVSIPQAHMTWTQPLARISSLP